jgi:glycine cleavage system H protein
VYPETLKYSETHEWVKVEGKTATVGLTHHAQSELGDIVYVELPAVGTAVAAGKELGVIESVKAASDVYAPLSGTVTAVNDQLAKEPAVINRDPYGAGWLVKVELKDAGEAAKLKTAAEYKKFIGA